MLTAPGSRQYFLEHSLAQGSQFKDLQEVEGDKTKFATYQLISGKREALRGNTKIVDTRFKFTYIKTVTFLHFSICCFRW